MDWIGWIGLTIGGLLGVGGSFALAQAKRLRSTTPAGDTPASESEWEARLNDREKILRAREVEVAQMRMELQQGGNIPRKQPDSAPAPEEATVAPVTPTAPPDSSDLEVILSTLIESSSASTTLVSPQGEILSWNRATKQVFGVPAANQDFFARIAPESRGALRAALQALSDTETGTTYTLELLGARPDGTAFPLELTLIQWKQPANEETAVLLVARDTSLARQLSTIRQEKEHAERANQVKSQFLADMSHELRTPLTAIIGFSEVLEDGGVGQLNTKQVRYVNNIATAGRHLLELVNEILDLAKVEAGQLKLEYASFPPAAAAQTVETLLRGFLQKKNQTLEIVTEPELPPLLADSSKFKQILFNLVHNAIKFTPEGGQITLQVGTTDAGGQLFVTVQDNGIGIPPEQLEHIFEPFQQLDNTFNREEPGAGLGLALVRKFTQLHGGRVWAQSDGEGCGTTVFVTLPYAAALPQEVPITLPSSAPQAANRPVVLLVTEAGEDAERLIGPLQDQGYDLARAENATDARTLAEALHLSAILIDTELPDRQGWELFSVLSSNPVTQACPLIAIAPSTEYSRALEQGVVSCVSWPIDFPQLQRLLSTVTLPESTEVSTQERAA